MRIEPPPSLAWATGNMPEATAAAAPPLEPPGVCCGFHGLRVAPNRLFSVTVIDPNSGVLVRPVRMNPARRKARATGSVSVLSPGRAPSEPKVTGWPATGSRSLMGSGTPANGGRSSTPAAMRSPRALASARASSSLRQITALSSGLRASTRAREASSTSSGLTSMVRMAVATSRADACSSMGPG